MAESIYIQLENRSVVTPVNGTEYIHPLPVNLFPSAEVFEDGKKLISWANENNFTAELIQKGLQKAIIEVRAAFKACPKDKVWSESMGLENVADMKWSEVKRPSQKVNVSQAIIDAGLRIATAMKANNINDDIIRLTLVSFKPDEVKAIMSALNEQDNDNE